ATTWLYHVLSTHEAIWLPPIKELRYLWYRRNFPNEGPWKRIFNFDDRWHRRAQRDYIRSRLRSLLSVQSFAFNRDYRRFCWDFRYAFAKHTDRWYLDLFKMKEGRLSGDLSPQYFFLPHSDIGRIAQFLPETRFLFTLRNPVDWNWSFYCMDLKSGHATEDFKDFDDYLQCKFGGHSFSRSVLAWQSAIRERNLKILWFEDLASDPRKYIDEVCDFLQICPRGIDDTLFHDKINVGSSIAPPMDVRRILKERWASDVSNLDKTFTLPNSWVSEFGL
ncbi:MAG: sulfotransferase, partial [Verrucomicrobiota bacterium]